MQPRRHRSLEQRSLEIWCEKDTPTAAYPRNWETICNLNIKPGLSKMFPFSSADTIRVSNILDPDQDRHSVGPDLGPNCLQRFSADKKKRLQAFACKERVSVLLKYWEIAIFKWGNGDNAWLQIFEQRKSL